MEAAIPPEPVSFDQRAARPIGWQVQMRVDFVVNQVMQSHRGQAEETVRQALHEQLRSIGVVPNHRQIQQYAVVIAQLPRLPPPSTDGKGAA